MKAALSSEIRISDEQTNLASAEAYYADNPRIHVPRLHPLSTENVTAMEFVVGDKITDAHLGRPDARREMARRLSDVLTIDVIFASEEEAIFHGDPHAGNVFHISEDATDPYQIALLDWGSTAASGVNNANSLSNWCSASIWETPSGSRTMWGR